MGFIYLIIPEEYKSLKGKNIVYKVGMTENDNVFDYIRTQKKRYGDNPEILETFEFDSDITKQVEDKILENFKNDPRIIVYLRTSKSREYFNVFGRGSKSYIRQQIKNICETYVINFQNEQERCILL